MWKWPTWLREKALIRLETFSEPLVLEVMPLAGGRWKHLRDQRVDSASFFSSFLEGSGGYHSTSTIAPQANNLSVKGRPFPLGYVQRQQCRNCLGGGWVRSCSAGQIDDELWYLIVDGDGDSDAPWVRWLFKGIPESELISDERSGAMWRRRENGKESFTRCVRDPVKMEWPSRDPWRSEIQKPLLPPLRPGERMPLCCRPAQNHRHPSTQWAQCAQWAWRRWSSPTTFQFVRFTLSLTELVILNFLMWQYLLALVWLWVWANIARSISYYSQLLSCWPDVLFW